MLYENNDSIIFFIFLDPVQYQACTFYGHKPESYECEFILVAVKNLKLQREVSHFC